MPRFEEQIVNIHIFKSHIRPQSFQLKLLIAIVVLQLLDQDTVAPISLLHHYNYFSVELKSGHISDLANSMKQDFSRVIHI